ncbi:helix-turn-helix domain-containing protein [Psychrilyobacter atlanticus]|uniref:helix-turn-helix domain-containing protein n=1 Tax=Psychrilyobacter atlanticus TaxID=271091 RepID=UPI00040B0992|nr:helix-turn-helix domain-containing protein [Psychrilyobacter atlanticus]
MTYVKSKIMQTGEIIFTVVYLSSLLGVDETTVRRYIYNHQLKSRKICGVYLIERSDILKFLELYNYYS